MSLPPALLARLKKRGIVKDDSTIEPEPKKVNSDNKESPSTYPVFAESCPNKYNPYHVCVEFCHKTWGSKISRYQLPMEYLEAKHNLLLTHPLAPGWREMFDECSGQHYFWYPPSNLVSWLPPSHPEAQITIPCYKKGKSSFNAACTESEALCGKTNENPNSEMGPEDEEDKEENILLD
uniref:WW domain-containing protein n=1 Tax=Rhabditophanes sp. KR3021 TaxID=114890 RepID=A0AC35TT72_9BILA